MCVDLTGKRIIRKNIAASLKQRQVYDNDRRKNASVQLY